MTKKKIDDLYLNYKRMKRILLFLFICISLLGKAQVYNNEWIDYSKTYYKFKIGPTGLYRITQPTLNSLGLGNIPAQNFQLWRNGQQITLYTSVPSGALGNNDYIEFWGEMNDGKPDKQLYPVSDYQLNDHWSLQSDTAFYFLTVNPAGPNNRFVNTINDVAGNVLPPEPYFIYTLGKYYKDKINGGYAALVGDAYVYSSVYDKGEGWTSYDIGTGATVNNTYSNLHVYSSGPIPTFNINAAGNALNLRTFRVKINGTSVFQSQMNFFDYVRGTNNFPLSLITSNTASIDIINECTSLNDRMVVAQFEMVYPRQFDFDNLKNFTFKLPANPGGNYVEISNFNYGASAPVLYDLTNGKRYVADISNPALIKIALQPSAVDRTLLLVSEDASNITGINSFQTRNMVNYGLASNQGNYLIISHPLLFNGASSNPVDDYRAYRSSPAGGSYNAKIYDINELVDQFAFGIKKHPSSVKNFVQFALNTYGTPPKFVFLIGHGVNYTQYRAYESDPDPTTKINLDKLNLVPTFGNPASDNLFSCYNGNEIPSVPIGRLSAVFPDEVSTYLKKVQDYESAQAFASCLIADKAWMKNVVHVVGADDGSTSGLISLFMEKYRQIIADTLFGANVNTFNKNSSAPVEQLNSERLQELFQEGLSLILYFGHSSASTLEFNLDDPANYNNPGKYPVFTALGCNAGNIYNYDPNRFLTKSTISEKFVFAQDRGSIAFIASTSLGIIQYLDIVNTENYTAISETNYGKTLGEIMHETILQTFNITTQLDFYARVHCEQISMNGDPALKYNTHAKPDYAIEDPLVYITPSFISVAETNFKVKAKIINLGKAIDKNIVVETKRTYPNNVTQVIQRDTIPGVRYSDSITVIVPIIPTRDKGLNRITIKVDADNVVDELCKTNNTVTKDVFIYEDEARPVYPYNYSIVNKQNIKLVASTANPFASLKQYRLELDTSELFNSPFKVTTNINSVGGVLEFNPGITFTDSTVYYWRVAQIPTSGQPKWNDASFVYLSSSDPGFNQSHFYQHTKSTEQRMHLDSTSRLWDYDSVTNNLFIRNAIFPTAATQQADFTISVNDVAYIGGGCYYDEVIINVFDARTFKPWVNNYSLYPGFGIAHSLLSTCANRKINNFEYLVSNSTSRKYAMDFLDSVPNGSFVAVRANANPVASGNTFPSVWRGDTLLFGSGNSLYHKFFNQGFTGIDSMNTARTWIFLYKKNDQGHFQPMFVFSQGNYDKITLNANCITPDSLGYMTSPMFGPAKSWKQLHWRGNTLDAGNGDNPTVDVIGINAAGAETTLISGLNLSQQDFDISSINANAYRFIKLKMRNLDSIYFTPYQMRYWRITCVPVPEGAIAPNIYLQTKDTVDIGEPLDFKIAFKNVSDVPFDSLKIKMVITDRNNVPNILPVPRQKPLVAGDTLIVHYTIDTRRLPGLNNLYVNVNPDFDQPEQYLFNNFAYRNLYVRPDSLNPLMDVTFDGVHILNRDIVSAKPHIVVKLKDEAKWMVLTDTSLVTVKVRYPDGSLHRFYFVGNDTLRFTPAGPAPNVDNTATIDFLPYFMKDGEYELIVTGKDMSNNQAGNMEYRVAFDVINKPMISNMLNYPNPFTTSTAFVFTVTGSEVPQNIKIEIMTITGKIVREITRDELGPLHIGRNITEFKWDGTDQFGQKLANGIYLYRVVTNLNGKSLDKYKADEDNTDKYFKKGYGKMYLMR
jgi:hypothetical protein